MVQITNECKFTNRYIAIFHSQIRNIFVIYTTVIFSSCKQPQINFADHVAPLIHKNCTSCHRTEEAGPFKLISYNDVAKRGKLIEFVTATKFMPPWPADITYSHFTGEKFLTEQEIQTIKDWVEQGMIAGDTSEIRTPAFSTATPLKPDLILKMPQLLFLKGDNKDKFFLMKFPYELPHDTFIRAIEFVPGNKKLVHHMNGFMVQYDKDKKKDVFEGEWFTNAETADFKTAYEKMKIPNDDGSYPMLTPSVCNYLPGTEATIYPYGIGGFNMKRKGFILFRDIHYGPSRIDQYDSSYVKIYFAAKPPARRTLELQLGTLGVSKIVPPLIIPPNEIKTFHTQYTLPADISVLTINPHMHLLGRFYHAYAITISGDTIPLVKINKWDFRWQYFYTFKKMLKIPAGSTIYVTGVYDNTKNNPLNPFDPPQQISERENSMRTTDEMFQFIITYLPYKSGDEEISLD